MYPQNYIYGIHPVIEAIDSGKSIDKIYLQKGLHGVNYKRIQETIKKYKIPFKWVPREKLRCLTLKNHQGVFAFISPIEFHKIDDLIPILYERGKNPLLLVLDRITDVRNFGSIVRTAECGGVDAILIPQNGSTLINSDAIKASSGAILKLPICKEYNLYKSLLILKNYGIQLVAAEEKAFTTFYEVDFSLPIAILIGNEQSGLDSSYLSLTEKQVKLPMVGKISSMNVSVVCGVLIYEVIRRRYAKIT
ncbi:putative tRNA:rRNA methyltransferase [Candidatus Uzinura diaspidicola str. ASNER]|uniref:Putative tRNA:rRNA methyltransferase n=1 Tax=Candidatus Uzinura diaspidicola str. ASNER TaxID=1133592 RepID=L7VK24_9FLAO|nr:putative tRNA:rRNA methyltransferase [Candidatus Uzinura diaspidicola str. ASNER]